MSMMRVEPGFPVRIGLCIVRDGKHVSYGAGVYEGAHLAVSELPALHGHDVQLIAKDDVPDRGCMWHTVADFVKEQVVAVIGPMTFGCAQLALPPLAAAGICALVPSIGNPDLTRLGYPNVLRVDFDAGAQAMVQAEYAYSHLKARRVAIVHDNSVFWSGVARVFELAYRRFANTVVNRILFELPLSPRGHDINRAIRLSAYRQVDLIYAASNEPELITLLQALRRGGNQVPFLACAALTATRLTETSAPLAGKVYTTEWRSPQGNYESFASRFRNTYDHEPGYYSAEAFDAATAVVRALHQVAVERDKEGTLEVDQQSLLKALRSGRFNGVTGDIEFDSKGDRLDQGNMAVVPMRGSDVGPSGRSGAGTRPASTVARREKQPASPGAELFYSYSSADERLRKELEKHLALLQRQGVISGWHFRKIVAGENWEQRIDEHLNSAQVILLLISADFMASDYCFDKEMQRALDRHDAGEARVIPVILRDCEWNHSRLSELQALPTGAIPVTSCRNRDKAFTDVAKGIRAAIAEMTGQA